MQCRDGGWAAFDVDNDRELCRRAPVLRLRRGHRPARAPTSPPTWSRCSPSLGRDGTRRSTAASTWLWRAQEADGSWFGRWGANHVYGTGAAVPALVAAGVADPTTRACAGRSAWLTAHQNADGGWGEDLRCTTTPRGAAGRLDGVADGMGPARPAARRANGGRRHRAGRRLLAPRRQRADGTWDEPEFTGTGFPGDFYINYHLYRQVFPVMALGRYRAGARPVSLHVVAAPLPRRGRVRSCAACAPARASCAPGMGPQPAPPHGAGRCDSTAAPSPSPGSAEGSTPTLRAGQVVVADRVRTTDGIVAPCRCRAPSAGRRAAAGRARRRHRPARVVAPRSCGRGQRPALADGRRAGRRHGVGVAARRLVRRGVDPRRLAVVRVVADTAGHASCRRQR